MLHPIESIKPIKKFNNISLDIFNLNKNDDQNVETPRFNLNQITNNNTSSTANNIKIKG